MSGKQAKKLRKIVSPDDPIARRNYRRLKRAFKSLSKSAKKQFIDDTKAVMHSIDP
tara:strand:+ start:152 stop:319 length:168 start_codon:yes stop_codon:yes gene_type:complete